MIVLFVMTGFFEHKFGKVPWMGKAAAGLIHSFEVKVDSITIVEDKAPWGEVTEAVAEFRRIQLDGDEFADDGKHPVPFWACGVLQEALGDIRKGWQRMEFERTEEAGTNKKGQPATINYASIRLV